MRYILSVLLLAAMPAGAQSLGEREYVSNCAACHGADGAGTGPLAELLTAALPDLRQLKANNGGDFPFERVFRIIDGRDDVAAHGGREMPVWGDEYNARAVSFYTDFYAMDNPEVFVNGRILSLITYLQSLQQ